MHIHDSDDDGDNNKLHFYVIFRFPPVSDCAVIYLCYYYFYYNYCNARWAIE